MNYGTLNLANRLYDGLRNGTLQWDSTPKHHPCCSSFLAEAERKMNETVQLDSSSSDLEPEIGKTRSTWRNIDTRVSFELTSKKGTREEEIVSTNEKTHEMFNFTKTHQTFTTLGLQEVQVTANSDGRVCAQFLVLNRNSPEESTIQRWEFAGGTV